MYVYMHICLCMCVRIYVYLRLLFRWTVFKQYFTIKKYTVLHWELNVYWLCWVCFSEEKIDRSRSAFVACFLIQPSLRKKKTNQNQHNKHSKFSKVIKFLPRHNYSIFFHPFFFLPQMNVERVFSLLKSSSRFPWIKHVFSHRITPAYFSL